MKLLLLLSLTILLYTALGLLPAPQNLSVSSVNFRHTLHWTPGPGTPKGAIYQVSKRCPKKHFETTKTEAELRLQPMDTNCLRVRSSFNKSSSPWSKKIFFTPYLDTTITAPDVTVSRCGECGQCITVNITLPRPHNSSGIQDIREVYRDVNYKISIKTGQDVVQIQTRNQTEVIPHLLPASEYCVQVKPEYLNVKFQLSPLICVFTSIAQPSQVFAVVGTVTVLVLLGVSTLILVLLSLQYAGILCKLKEALPHTLITVLSSSSPLNPEKTDSQPVSISPVPEKVQASSSTTDSSSDEEDYLESGALYKDRGADLSSDSSSSGGHVSQSSQSSAVAEQSERVSERTYEGKHEEKIQSEGEKVEIMQKDSEEPDKWDEGLENSGDVNLFSVIVTVAALDLHPDTDPHPSDLEPLLHTDFRSEMCNDSPLPQQQHLSDMEEEEEEEEVEMSNYMCH